MNARSSYSYIITLAGTDVTRLVAGRFMNEAVHINENYNRTIHACKLPEAT